MRSFLLSAVTLLLAAHAPAVMAQTLHKCVDGSGKSRYSDRPCEGAPGKVIRVAPLPTPVVKVDEQQEDDEYDEYEEYDRYAHKPEPVEESDAQVYARKALERRTEALKRKQALADAARAARPRPCKIGNNC